VESSPASSVIDSDEAPGMTCRSLAQSPRSISLQRSEQNGRQRLSVTQGTALPQLGHSTLRVTMFHRRG